MNTNKKTLIIVLVLLAIVILVPMRAHAYDATNSHHTSHYISQHNTMQHYPRIMFSVPHSCTFVASYIPADVLRGIDLIDTGHNRESCVGVQRSNDAI